MSLTKNTISVAQHVKNIPELGNTRLSVVSVDGSLFVVDQDGKMINGLISVSSTSAVDCLTTMNIEVYSHRIDENE